MSGADELDCLVVTAFAAGQFAVFAFVVAFFLARISVQLSRIIELLSKGRRP